MRAESGWNPSVGDAEYEAQRAIEAQIQSTMRRLESTGRSVVGGTSYSTNCRERRNGEYLEYMCFARSDIHWVEQPGLVEDNLKAAPAAPGADIVVEQELLARARPAIKPDGSTTLRLKTLRIVKSDVKTGALISSLPSSVARKQYIVNNATDQHQKKSITLSVTTREGEVFRFTNSVTTANEIQFGLKFSIADASGRRAWTTVIGRERTSSREVTEAHTEEFTQEVPPHTTLVVTITREVLSEVFALSGTITFDGTIESVRTVKDVYACSRGPFRTGRCVRMKTTKKSYDLSQLLPEQRRTIKVDGRATISSSANTTSTTTYESRPLGTNKALADDDDEFGTEVEYLPGMDYEIVDDLSDEVT